MFVMKEQDESSGSDRHTCNRIMIATFANAKSTRGTQHTLPWFELSNRLIQHAEQPRKDGPAYSPAIYRDQKVIRANENVEAVTAIVFDMDSSVPFDQLRERLAPYSWAAHTTYSHSEDDPRYRIIVPLARPVPADQWRTTWEAANRVLTGGRADPACKDPARIYYRPSCPAGADRWADRNEGLFLDPDDLPHPVSTPPSPPTNGNGKHPPSGDLRPGDFYNQRGGLGEIRRTLLRHQWTCTGHAGDEEYWRRPGKDDGHSATLNYQGSGQLYVFSGNAAPFDPEKPYSAFAVRTLLDFAGDFPECARALRAEGYGAAPAGDATDEVEVAAPIDTDLGIVRYFGDQYKDLFRRVADTDELLGWRGQAWDRRGPEKHLTNYVEDLRDSMIQEAAGTRDRQRRDQLIKASDRLTSAAVINRVMSLAINRAPILVRAQDLDRHMNLFVAANCVVDLETGETYDGRQDQLLTLSSPARFVVGAECPETLRALRRVLPDEEVLDYVLRYFGASLWGGFHGKCFPFFFGKPDCGKTFITSLWRKMLGSYAIRVDAESFMANPRGATPGAARPDLVPLHRKRLVIASELSQKWSFNAELLKSITGGSDEAYAVRGLYGKPFNLEPSFIPVFYGNSRPLVAGKNKAFFERMGVIPCEQVIPLADRQEGMHDALFQREAPGILNLFLHYYTEWRDRPLSRRPAAVRTATETYAESASQGAPSGAEEDMVDLTVETIARACAADAQGRIEVKELYPLYVSLCRGAGQRAAGKHEWYDELRALGHEVGVRGGKTWLLGFRRRKGDDPKNLGQENDS